MEKPYDEVHLSDMELSFQAGLIRDEQMLYDWIKFELQADDLELFKSPELRGWTVRYKRNQLQYG